MANDKLATRETLKKVRKAMDERYVIEGEFSPDTIVGKALLADNFDSKMVLTDNSGYLYRTTGGSLEVGKQNRVKKIIGASVPIIQDINHGNFDSGTTGWQFDTSKVTPSVSNNVLTMTTLGAITVSNAYLVRAMSTRAIPVSSVGHKMLIHCEIMSSVAMQYEIAIAKDAGQASQDFYRTIPVNTWISVNILTTLTNYQSETQGFKFMVFPYGNADSGLVYKVRNVNVIDLTQTFGTTVANRLATLESSSAGTGIAKAKEILVKDYYPYNVTAFTHTKTSGKVNTGFNQFDLSAFLTQIGDPINAVTNAHLNSKVIWKNDCGYEGRINVYRTGITKSGSGVIYYRCRYSDGTQDDYLATNIISEDGWSKSANGKIVTSIYLVYSADGTHNFTSAKFGISFAWDGERDGEYEAYQEWNYPTEDIELKGILSLNAQDNWVADGDEYLPDGTINKNIAENNLANLTWFDYSSGVGKTYYAVLSTTLKSPNIATCTAYVNAGTEKETVLTNKTYSLRTNGNFIFLRDDACATASALVTALANVKLIYKKATPTQSSATPYTELQNDSNWGAEKWIDNRDVPLPVFSTCEYIPDLKAKSESAPESPEEDGDYIMHRENGINSYGLLPTWLSANNYYKMQDLSSRLTDVATGLVIGYLKVYKYGNVVTISANLLNSGNDTIASFTKLMQLPSGLYRSDTQFTFFARGAGANGLVSITTNGEITFNEAIPANQRLFINITYAVA